MGKKAKVMKLPPSQQDPEDKCPKSLSPIDIKEDNINMLTVFFN
jgi:hypothetical protein